MEGEKPQRAPAIVVVGARSSGPAHGYAVIQEIQRRSGGAFELPEGTIYPALHRLEQAGLLSSHWTKGKTGRERGGYVLTKPGTPALADQRAIWQRFADAIGGLLGHPGHAPARTGR